MDSGPWSYENNLLMWKRIGKSNVPQQVTLNVDAFWIQVHNLPIGFMSYQVAIIIGTYIGKYVEADPNNFISFYINYLRVRVEIDVTMPLK